jgi:hypothetical protein
VFTTVTIAVLVETFHYYLLLLGNDIITIATTKQCLSSSNNLIPNCLLNRCLHLRQLSTRLPKQVEL